MRLVIQRSLASSVKVDNKIVGSINNGLVILVGFMLSDSMCMLRDSLFKEEEK